MTGILQWCSHCHSREIRLTETAAWGTPFEGSAHRQSRHKLWQIIEVNASCYEDFAFPRIFRSLCSLPAYVSTICPGYTAIQWALDYSGTPVWSSLKQTDFARTHQCDVYLPAFGVTQRKMVFVCYSLLKTSSY